MLHELREKSKGFADFTGCTPAGANSATGYWHDWNKPKWANVVHFILIGAGGGGGKGLTGSAGSARGGGGGGASGALVRASFLATHLPDVLWIQTPIGGKGEDATAAQVGGRVWISVTQSITVANTVLRSGDADAPVGATGSTTGGAGGSGPSVFSSSNAVWVHLALGFSAVFGATGGNGGNGSSGTAGSAAGALSFLPVCGGGGGGSVNSSNSSTAGGDITGTGIVSTVPGGLATGTNGNGGLYIPQPWCTTGGSGGGGLNGQGGKGGDAMFGSGGGGGGGGTTGGFGGKGGDAICWVIST